KARSGQFRGVIYPDGTRTNNLHRRNLDGQGDVVLAFKFEFTLGIICQFEGEAALIRFINFKVIFGNVYGIDLAGNLHERFVPVERAKYLVVELVGDDRVLDINPVSCERKRNQSGLSRLYLNSAGRGILRECAFFLDRARWAELYIHLEIRVFDAAVL